MNNVRITNMDNGTSFIISREQFDTCRTSLSENTVYEYTNQPITQISIARRSGKNTIIKELQKIIGGLPNEIDRATVIRL